jgi:hypothetical protein
VPQDRQQQQGPADSRHCEQRRGGHAVVLHGEPGAEHDGASHARRDADRPVAEHVAGYLQRDGVDVVVGEVVVPGPGESVQGALDVGEERVAAQRGGQPDRAGLDDPYADGPSAARAIG